PMLIIFRQGAPRALEYVAERLQHEGWFDGSPWLMDQGLRGSERWFPEDYQPRDPQPILLLTGPGAALEIPPADLAVPASGDAVRAGREALSAWQQTATDKGFSSAAQKQQYESRARRYASLSGVQPGGAPPAPRPEDLEDPDTRDSYEAHQALWYLS